MTTSAQNQEINNAVNHPSALEWESLSQQFDSQLALRSTTARVASGDHLAIVGPSGAGKTTLLLLLAGLLNPTRGEIRQDGELVSRPGWQKEPRERDLGFVFQELALWPHLTVREHLKFALGDRAAGSDDRIDALLGQLALDSLEKRRPRELSGGERQRLAWARAVVGEPRLLLLDEPLTSLDPELRAELLEATLSYSQAPGRTIVVVTHDNAVAEAFGGNVLRLAPAAS